MKGYYSILKKCTVFKDIPDEAFDEVLSVLGAYCKKFTKNAVVRQPNLPVTEIGIVAEGLVYLTKTDYDGNRLILGKTEESKTFGESLAFANALNSPIAVIAAAQSTVIFISCEKLTRNSLDAKLHEQLIQNLIRLLAEKNILIKMKNDVLAQKTTREKLLLYLDYESILAQSKSFRIGFSREELADYLSVNVSAMSRELGKMRDDGILSFKRSKFVLKK